MTRKDYELIARVLRHDVETLVARQYLAGKFADALAAQNASFNRGKFMLAALGKNGVPNGTAT